MRFQIWWVVLVIGFALGCGGGGENLAEDSLARTDDVAVEVESEVGCTPSCAGKQCSEDGCGGSCGSCGPEQTCSTEGLCEGPCTPDCEEKECGDDGCGDVCGKCPEIAPICVAGKCKVECIPDCNGKECGDDGCGDDCGTCPEAAPVCADGKCQLACVPDCDGKECGDDGCGGLCNGCLDLVFDDGTTETAYGFASDPGYAPERVACVVRYELPFENMKLVQFTAGWMWGLYNMEVPFELAYISEEDMDCQLGSEQSWYNEICKTFPDKLVSIGNFVPAEPYTPMGVELLGEVVLPSKTIFIAALFDVDEYPLYVCPMDKSGDGANSFMMPQYLIGDTLSIYGASFDKKEENAGAIPFRIRVEL